MEIVKDLGQIWEESYLFFAKLEPEIKKARLVIKFFPRPCAQVYKQ